MSSKNKFRSGHAPRPTKTELHKAAQEQHKADEAKLVELATVDKGEVTPADVEVLKAAVGGDQQAAADAIVKNLAPTGNDPAAGNSDPGESSTPASSTSAAGSPPTSGEQAAAVDKLITEGTVRTPKGTTETGLYSLGKKYSPKTDRNSETWGKICKALADGPKTMKELAEAVKGHNDFLGYMTRGGHVVPYKPTETTAA